MTHPYNQASWFLAPLPQQPGFATSTDLLQILDNRGRLVSAAIEGPAGLPAEASCDALPAGGTITIPLERALIPWLHTVAITYSAETAGFINVGIGDGQPVAAEVIGGEHQVFVRAEGGESAITISSTDSNLCVESVRVGKVVPRDLPYGGGVDITDQLQGLQ